MNKTPDRKPGIILVGSLLLAAALLFVFIKPAKAEKKILIITKDGEEIVRQEIFEGFSCRVDAENGYNIFQAETGENGELGIRCIEADCPEQICVHKGRVVLTDDPIVCLPHHVTARLITGN